MGRYTTILNCCRLTEKRLVASMSAQPTLYEAAYTKDQHASLVTDLVDRAFDGRTRSWSFRRWRPPRRLPTAHESGNCSPPRPEAHETPLLHTPAALILWWQGAAIALVAAVACSDGRRSPTLAMVACVGPRRMLAAPALTLRSFGPPRGVVASMPGGRRAGNSNARSAPRGASFAADPAHPTARPARVACPPSGGPWARPSIGGTRIAVACLLVSSCCRAEAGLGHVRRLHRVALATAASAGDACRAGVSSRVAAPPTSSSPARRCAVVGCSAGDPLPVAALSVVDAAQVEAILAHELAHIRRHDYALNVLQTIAETLLFYHPAIWWVSNRIRAEREHCCDEIAVTVCGDPISYAQALAELESWRSMSTAMALAATGGSLLDRVRRILRVPIPEEPRSPSGRDTCAHAVFTAGAGSVQATSVGDHTR